jgi:hypothetical protein
LEALGELIINCGSGPKGCHKFIIPLVGHSPNKRGDNLSPVLGRQSVALGVTFGPKRGDQKSPESSCKPSIEPSIAPPTPSGEGNGVFQKSFDRFWQAYPRKRSKGQAERAFRALKPGEDLLDKMLAAIERQRDSHEWIKDGGQFIPYPATWLRSQGWLDEPTPRFQQLIAEPRCPDCSHHPHPGTKCAYCAAIARQNASPFGCSEILSPAEVEFYQDVG